MILFASEKEGRNSVAGAGVAVGLILVVWLGEAVMPGVAVAAVVGLACMVGEGLGGGDDSDDGAQPASSHAPASVPLEAPSTFRKSRRENGLVIMIHLPIQTDPAI
jgi:hypothetical protein